jgi:hypothetical protein
MPPYNLVNLFACQESYTKIAKPDFARQIHDYMIDTALIFPNDLSAFKYKGAKYARATITNTNDHFVKMRLNPYKEKRAPIDQVGKKRRAPALEKPVEKRKRTD